MQSPIKWKTAPKDIEYNINSKICYYSDIESVLKTGRIHVCLGDSTCKIYYDGKRKGGKERFYEFMELGQESEMLRKESEIYVNHGNVASLVPIPYTIYDIRKELIDIPSEEIKEIVKGFAESDNTEAETARENIFKRMKQDFPKDMLLLRLCELNAPDDVAEALKYKAEIN